MPLLSFERANQWVPLDFMLKTDKMKLPLHEFSFVKATAPSYFSALPNLMRRHLFNKHSISFCRIRNKHMRDSTYNLSVLQNRAAAHALNNPACLR